MKARGLAIVRWLLGDITDMPREANSGRMIVFVSFFAAIGMWFGLKHSFKGDPVLVGTWRGAVHGVVPLIGVGLWELRGATRPIGRFLAVFGLALLIGVVGTRFTTAGANYQSAQPLLHLALPLLVGAAVLLIGLHLGGVDLKKWGIGLGDWRWWLPHHGVLLVGLIPVLMLTTWLVPPLAAFYPTNQAARTSLDGFAWAHLGIALDFIGWEFLFRGLLLFAAARRGDALLAILFQVFPFFLLHYNKPEIELTSSFVGGIFAAWFCLRARTFLPLFVIHVTMISVVGFTSFLMRNGYLG